MSVLRFRLQVYPLHSSVTLEEQNVIDFCLARRMVCDQETNYQSLRLTWASKTNCNQRRGRAGRVSKGYCYRLVSKEFWRNEITDYMIPEMLLAPLTTIMLKVKLLDMGDPRSILSTALSPPNLGDIVKTVLQLKEMGALSAKSDGRGQNDDGELTFLGRVLAHLPVDLYLGKIIVLGHIFGCLDECLIIAQTDSRTTRPICSHTSKLAFALGTPSDSLGFVNAFKAWHLSKKKGQLRLPKDEFDWGKENFIQIKRIREVAELYDDLKKRVSNFNMHVPESIQSMDYTSTHRQKFLLQVVIAGAHYPNYFVQGELDEDLASRDLNGFNPRTTVMLKNLPPYPFLYYKQLQSLFRLCGQVKAISFEGTRAYVEFYKTSQGAGVLPEVSLALLLAQQSAPLELPVFSIEQIEIGAGVNVDFQSQSVCPVGVMNMTFDPDKLPPNPLFVVNITEVVDVGHFWGFRADEASLTKQRRLTAEINSCTLCPVTVSLYPNLLCLAPYSEANEQDMYYRAKILHMRGNTVEVFFLDFGNTAVVASSSLRELPPDIQSHPFQAQEFQVIGMQPSAKSIILGNQWSSQARERFVTLVKSRSLIVSLYSILHGVNRVQLLIHTDTSTNVVDIMQNHEALMSLYKDMEEGTYVPNSASSSWKDPFLPTPQALLHGPHSPYKMSFHSLNHKTLYKSVNIERISINSLALNENPQNKHQKMLVAGTVSVNASGTCILLKDTSIMPDIPGLPALLTMLFTPVMELRTNEERTCYTGALCGLGCNAQTKEGTRDIELTFDVKFDVEDITEINALRVAINRLVCEGPNGTMHLGPDRIRQLQDDCRDGITRLFTKSPPREAVTPVFYEKTDKWNQVDPALQMDIVDPGEGKTRGVLFQLHPVTLLNS
ncbi:putative ATP-dependent RNA helicase TDRD9 [Liparis tanakae]|uniref:RNA helicase n=1 Tax=Liparis tanakae TaxID=230148 RepID=A0A4Z2J2N7_9TELE|nr:putative ATP-dependent RNA helicase TDRD9 [Liparis tanakae]